MMTLGERVLLLRRRKLLTQEELARRVGIHPNTIARLERGLVKMLRGDTVADLARALGTSSDYLLGLVEEAGTEHEPRAAVGLSGCEPRALRQ